MLDRLKIFCVFFYYFALLYFIFISIISLRVWSTKTRFSLNQNTFPNELICFYVYVDMRSRQNENNFFLLINKSIFKAENWKKKLYYS